MSGIFDKKTEAVNRREARTQKELKEKKKVRIIATTIVVVLAVLFCGALFLNSKFIRRTLPAITIGDVNFTAVEFDYFYNSAYLEFSEMINSDYPDYSYLLPTGRPFSNQINYLNGEGEPWSETFIAMAVDTMTELAQFYSAAKAAGYTLTDEKRQELEDQISSLVMQAIMYGYPSFNSFLQMVYGPNIHEDSYRKVIEFSFIAREYSRHIYESFIYSDRELADYYNEKRDSLDNFTYRYFLVNAEYVYRDDFETDEEYEEASEAALEDAREKAAEIAAGVVTENDFLAAALDYNEDIYSSPDSTLIVYPGLWIGSEYESWIKDPERRLGDITTVDVASGTYIIFFVERDPNEYRMAEMRQILIMPETISADDYLEGEDDPQYLEDVENAWEQARERAETVLALFIEGGATEELLLELMEEYSDDWTEGGFYDEISKDMSHKKMIREVEEFLFDPSREYGDFELVKSEAYGYHLLFFMGYGERYCDYTAERGIRERDYYAWLDSFTPIEAVRRWAFILTMQ